MTLHPPGEIPVFWACGVTPQAAVMGITVPFAVLVPRPHVYHRYSERRGNNNKDVMCDFLPLQPVQFF